VIAAEADDPIRDDRTNAVSETQWLERIVEAPETGDRIHTNGTSRF
jgi:hypothetical protein